jgi:hypothetical protein
MDGYARAADLLAPVYYAQLSSFLQSKVLAMDETPIKTEIISLVQK